MIIYIGIDDTDNKTSRGTGRLARAIAADLGHDYRLLGVTRHQLLFDPRIPFTAKNSSATISVEAPGPEFTTPDALKTLFARVRAIMDADYQPGSDPGLCVAADVPQAIIDFGRQAQQFMVDQYLARQLAAEHGILLQGLGGNQGGVIGALASVGLAASGDDGRYIMVGHLRELSGEMPIETILAAGVSAVQTLDGEPVSDILLQADKLRPSRRNGMPIQYVAYQDGAWTPLKLD